MVEIGKCSVMILQQLSVFLPRLTNSWCSIWRPSSCTGYSLFLDWEAAAETVILLNLFINITW